MALAFRCFLCTVCAGSKNDSLWLEHFNSLSAPLVFFFFFCCLYRVKGCPLFVLCKFTQGLLHMLDVTGKERNKGGKENLFNKVGHAVLKAAGNKEGKYKIQRRSASLCMNKSLKSVV